MPDSRGVEFFPFHPIRLRVGLCFAAFASAVLTVSAFSNARAAREPLAWIRGVVCFGLFIGFSSLFIRLRPRVNWGVTVGPLGITISRPLTGEHQLAWSQVSTARLEGKRQDRFGIFARNGPVVWLDAGLFRSKAAFDSMTSAVRSRVETPRLDA